MKKVGAPLMLLAGVGLAFAFTNVDKNFNAEGHEISVSTLPDDASQNKSPAVGDMAPDFSGKSPEGKTYSLKDLRGDYVLIDFWASWCGPCRRENPNVVKAYRNYHSKDFGDGANFEIISVSLDKNAESWKGAIKKDNLTWEYHVSDLRGWGSSHAAQYGVRSIPQSFLVDPEGKIVAKDLRGAALEEKLESLVGN